MVKIGSKGISTGAIVAVAVALTVITVTTAVGVYLLAGPAGGHGGDTTTPTTTTTHTTTTTAHTTTTTTTHTTSPTTTTPGSFVIPSESTASPSEIALTYHWAQWSNNYTFTTYIPENLYEYYANKPRVPVRGTTYSSANYYVNYSYYVTDPKDDKELEEIVASFNEFAFGEGLGEEEKLDLMVGFVQSLPYMTDMESKGQQEYPRYPVETLVNNVGDCEDTAILMASLLKLMGYDAVLLDVPEHMAVGISSDYLTFYGFHYSENNKEYYYVETTEPGWSIGEIPEEYSDVPAYLVHLVPVPMLTHTWISTWTSDPTNYTADLTVTVKNEGTATAEDVYVFAGFDAGGNMAWGIQTSDNFTLNVDSEKTVTLQLTLSRGYYTRLMVEVIYGGYAVDKSYSDWFTT
jgi:transglutaminase-like putative cysteine protease